MEKKTVKYYNKKHELHNEFEPAILVSENGEVVEALYYLDGKEYNYNDWLSELMNRGIYEENRLKIKYYKKVKIDNIKFFYWLIEAPEVWNKKIKMHKKQNGIKG